MVVELMTLVSLGLSPSLHPAAPQTKHLPVSLAALYDNVNRTEPAILRALVQGSHVPPQIANLIMNRSETVAGEPLN
jgi:IS4 transposase